ncbi:MAG: N-acetylmuramoyl-L-alanine amidase [Clostridia bacterium]|nr:N-acetylmuramoyl-L-alanine amidase [Clostridia bacterium]
MKILKENGFNSLLLAVFPAFVCVCVIFAFISSSFCKVSTMNTSTNDLPHSLPVLIIDAGHGGEDGGTVGINGVFEKELNLKIAENINQLALSCGYDTVMTRSEDVLLYDRNVDFKGRKKALDLLARVKIAEKYENAVFISIHMNAFPDGKYSGLQVYYSKNNEGSKELAESIQATVKNTLQASNNRKIKVADENIFVLDRVTHPAVLIECGFLSNEEECTLLSSEEYQKKLALSIFFAVSKYIEMPT